MPYHRILVGTDGSATADKAVMAAAGLARQLGADLHVVTAYKKAGGGIGAASGAAMAGSGAAEGVQTEAARQIADKAAALWGEGLMTRSHAVSGSAADAILTTAQSCGADLIVVGSKGMQGPRRVLGSVPNSVAHGAHCSVLVVKTA
jgi:nucleotide-binding universal stress UspA family protein